MAGIKDGRFIEEGTIPTNRLIDTFVLETTYDAKMTLLDNLDISLQGQITTNDTDILALQTDKADQTSLDAHTGTGISTAHGGQLNSTVQIPNLSIAKVKLSFNVATLDDIDNHANMPITTAHSGFLNPVTQIDDRTIPSIKLVDDFPSLTDFLNHINNTTIHFTLDPTLTSASQAAPANHTHAGGPVTPHASSHAVSGSDSFVNDVLNANILGYATTAYYAT